MNYSWLNSHLFFRALVSPVGAFMVGNFQFSFCRESAQRMEHAGAADDFTRGIFFSFHYFSHSFCRCHGRLSMGLFTVLFGVVDVHYWSTVVTREIGSCKIKFDQGKLIFNFSLSHSDNFFGGQQFSFDKLKLDVGPWSGGQCEKFNLTSQIDSFDCKIRFTSHYSTKSRQNVKSSSSIVQFRMELRITLLLNLSQLHSMVSIFGSHRRDEIESLVTHYWDILIRLITYAHCVVGSLAVSCFLTFLSVHLRDSHF